MSMRMARTLPSAGRLKLTSVPGRMRRNIGLILGCAITSCSWRWGMPSSVNTLLRVCPGLIETLCQ